MSQHGSKYYPALKHAVTFAFGIASAYILNVPPDALVLPLAVSLLWTVAAFFQERLLLPAAVVVTVLLSGGLSYALRSESRLPALRNVDERDVELVGVVASDPIQKDGRIELIVKPDSLLYRNSSAPLSGNVLFRLYDSTLVAADAPQYGAKIAVKGTFRISSGIQSPGGFDYGAWLASQGIAGTFECYRSTEVYQFGTAESGLLAGTLRSVQLYVRRFIREHADGEEGDILQALLLGQRQEIDPSTKEAFARTGTSHVLAVSGLHVGIIILALFVSVSWFRNRWLRFALFAGMLAGYVVLVGGAPSVLRASVMATVFLLAYNTGRISRPLNTLGVAALLLLLYNPCYLFDVGFQLSFAAVAGIMFLYSPIVGWFSAQFPRAAKNLLVQRTVQLLTISLSAQLFTLPLTLHYFGYVSVISPLVNIVVVPLIALALGSGVAGILLAFLPVVSDWFGAVAWLTIRSVMQLVEWGASLDIAGINTITLGWLSALLLLAGILYVALSRSGTQVAIRSFSLILLLLLLPSIERRADPLANSDSGYLYLLPLSREGGIITALHRGDTLSVCYGGMRKRDSIAAASAGNTLAGRIGAGTVRLYDLASDDLISAGWNGKETSSGLNMTHVNQTSGRMNNSDLCRVNGVGPEFLSSQVPVLFTNSGRRPLGFVLIDEMRFAQIPLQRKLSETIVLSSQPDWHVVRWR